MFACALRKDVVVQFIGLYIYRKRLSLEGSKDMSGQHDVVET